VNANDLERQFISQIVDIQPAYTFLALAKSGHLPAPIQRYIRFKLRESVSAMKAAVKFFETELGLLPALPIGEETGPK
jgi:hypothetical protein